MSDCPFCGRPMTHPDDQWFHGGCFDAMRILDAHPPQTRREEREWRRRMTNRLVTLKAEEWDREA